jgi:hypothetical protein
MRRIERVFIPVALALMVFVAGAGLVAQEQAEPREPMQIQGELIEVDTENRVIVVRTAAETPMRFQYNDETEIAGAQESVAGLATAQNARVTVHFTQEGDVRTASKVEVQEAEAPSAPGV